MAPTVAATSERARNPTPAGKKRANQIVLDGAGKPHVEGAVSEDATSWTETRMWRH